MSTNSSLLKNALLGNAVFSSLSGLGFVFFSKAIAAFLGISAAWVIIVIGVGLLGYGWQLYRAATASPLDSAFARFAVYADLAWVVLSAVLIFSGMVAFTTAGKWAIAAVADIVLVFAIVQYVGVKRLAQ